jgi:hypothetical protein
MTRVALVTCMKLPERDDDESLLVEGLHKAGLHPEVAAWDDERVDWSKFDLAIIRSTWNYHLDRDRFLDWAETVAKRTRLWNPLGVVRWNTHKSYLMNLESAGIAIVPTLFLKCDSTARLAALVGKRGYDRVVIKPAVSAASYKTACFDRDTLAEGDEHLADILAKGDALVQPYLRSVESTGERAIVCIDGNVTHAVRKRPRFGGEQESVSTATQVSDDERRFANRVFAALPVLESLLYARVDVARDDEGGLRLMELELTEPSLFLAQHPPALERFVVAIDKAAKRISERNA